MVLQKKFSVLLGLFLHPPQSLQEDVLVLRAWPNSIGEPKCTCEPMKPIYISVLFAPLRAINLTRPHNPPCLVSICGSRPSRWPPRDSLVLVSVPLYHSHLHWITAGLWPIGCYRSEGVCLLRLDGERRCISTILFWDHSLWRKPAAILLEHSSNPMEGSSREELRPPADSQHWLAIFMSEPSWKQVL